jgi:transcriptional regulator with XRE-family HTH domain
MPTEKDPTLSDYVRTRRVSRGLDYAEAEQRSGVDQTTWRKLEAGSLESPSARTLEGVAEALSVPLPDLLQLAGYQVWKHKLPGFTPYLRSRYNLPSEAVAQLEQYFQMLRSYYGIPDDESVFPPIPKPRSNSLSTRRRVAPKRRAA